LSHGKAIARIRAAAEQPEARLAEARNTVRLARSQTPLPRNRTLGMGGSERASRPARGSRGVLIPSRLRQGWGRSLLGNLSLTSGYFAILPLWMSDTRTRRRGERCGSSDEHDRRHGTGAHCSSPADDSRAGRGSSRHGCRVGVEDVASRADPHGHARSLPTIPSGGDSAVVGGDRVSTVAVTPYPLGWR
jgi:hypothetical protein